MPDLPSRLRGLGQQQLNQRILPGEDKSVDKAHWLHVDYQRDCGMEGKGMVNYFFPYVRYLFCNRKEIVSLSAHFTSLHFTSLHLTSADFTSADFTSLHFTFTLLHFTLLHFTFTSLSLQFNSLHVTSADFTSADFTSLHFSWLHSTSLSLHFSWLHSTSLEQWETSNSLHHQTKFPDPSL
jgi:hypothetical protein